MKKIIATLFIFWLCLNFASAQAIKFRKEYSLGTDSSLIPTKIISAINGSYILSGYSGVWPNQFPYVFRIDESGNILWVKRLNYPHGGFAYSITKTFDNNYVIAGDCSMDSINQFQVFILKIDLSGNILFSKQYTLPGHDYDFNYSPLIVNQLSDSGFIIHGYDYSNISFFGNTLLIKLNSVGDFLWSTLNDSCDKVDGADLTVSMNPGSFVISEGSSDSQTFVTKFDNNGIVVWSKRYFEPVPTGSYAAIVNSKISKTIDNGYVIAGAHSKNDGSGNSEANLYVMKIDSLGNVIWSNKYSDATYLGSVFSVQETFDKGVIVLGLVNNNYANNFLLKLDSAGNILWKEQYLYPNFYQQPTSLIETNDSGYCFCGYLNDGNNPNEFKFFLTKTDVWGKTCNTFNLSITKSSLVIHSIDSVSSIPITFVPSFVLPEIESVNVTTNNSCWPEAIDEQINSLDISIYPNPFTEDFQLSITDAETDAEVSIYNIIGQQQEHLTISHSKSIHQILSLRNYSAGVYLVSITVNGKRFMRKVVKS